MKDAFPRAKGFSTTNLWYMKKWYLFYKGGSVEKLQQLVGELDSSLEMSGKVLRQIAIAPKLQQAVEEFPFPVAFAYVPWGHHIAIITKCGSIEEALYYIRRTIEEGWSRSTLENAIEGDFYHISGKAMPRVTPSYALLIYGGLYGDDLPIFIKSLIIERIQLCRKYGALCRTTT